MSAAATPARRRWALWLALLAGAAGLALFGDKTPSGAVRGAPAPGAAAAPAVARAAAPRTPPRSGSARAEPVEPLRPRAAPEARPGRQPAADLFAVAAWRRPPPPPPPAAPAAAAPKAAPPLPALNYRVLGKKEENQTWEVYLGRDDLSFIARAGETLEGLWRVERIEPPNMTLVHVPSGQPLILPIGDGR